MNEITIVGNVTADPVLRKSANGRGVIRFDVAVNRRRFNRDTNQYDDLPPVFHRVVAFGPVAENAAETLRKGLEVVVVGQIADDSYETEAGESDGRWYLKPRSLHRACGLPRRMLSGCNVNSLHRNLRADTVGRS